MQAVESRVQRECDIPLGLSRTDAAGHLAMVGPNARPERPPDPFWRRFARQYTGTRPFLNPYLHAAVLVGMGVQVAGASLLLTAGLLGHTRLPTELWVFVFAGTLLAWALAETISRLVWRADGNSETNR